MAVTLAAVGGSTDAVALTLAIITITISVFLTVNNLKSYGGQSDPR